MADSESNTLLADIHAALLNDDAEQLDACCGGDVHLDAQFTADINPQHVGMTPVALACALNKPELARILLEHGADPNAPFATLYTTSLMTAAFHGHADVVRLLLDYGADVLVVDLQKSTALGYAFGGTRSVEVVELLLRAGVDVNHRNMLGMNALLLVSGYGNDQLVEMVLRAGADPNATNEFGHTALHLAVVGKKDQLRKLRQLGTVDAALASRSLNRRNLDLAMKEWARLHKDAVVGTPSSDEALERAGKFMMSIGQKIDDSNMSGDVDSIDDEEIMKRSVEAVWKYRQEKIQEAKAAKKSGVLGTLLSCGGGKSKGTTTMSNDNRPAAKAYNDDSHQPQQDHEVVELNERSTRILRMLIESGCDIDATEKTFGMTALDMAILSGDVESSALLVTYGGDDDHLLKMFALCELYNTIVNHDKRGFKDLLTYDHDLDVNMALTRFNLTRQPGADNADSMGDEGLTPITVASRNNDNEMLKMLIKHGANVNDPGLIGRTSMHETAAKGYLKTIQFLLTQKADAEQPSAFFKNATPIVVAVMFRKIEIVKFLIKRGCKVDKPMLDGRVALFLALEANDREMVTVLLEADLIANYIDAQGFMAAMANKYQAKDRDVEMILQEASDVVKNFNDREAAMIAEEEAKQQAAKMDTNANRRVAPARAVTVELNQHQPAAIATEPIVVEQPAVVSMQPAVVAAQPGYVTAAQPAVVAEQPGFVVAAQPTIAAQPGFVVAPQPAVVAEQPGFVVAAQPTIAAQPGFVVAPQPAAVAAQPSFVVAPQPAVVAEQPGFVVAAQPMVAERAQPGFVVRQPSPQQQQSDEDISSDDADSESITDSDEEAPPIPSQAPPPPPAVPPPDDSDESEEEESEEEEDDDDDDFTQITRTTVVRTTTITKNVPQINALHDDLDDISDSSEEEEEESEEEEEDEETFEDAKDGLKKVLNGQAEKSTVETTI